MRFSGILILLLLIVSCNKNKPVARKLEGKWHLYKLLLNEGQYIDKDEIYEFAKGSDDGATYTGWTRYTATDTINGLYVVSEKGQKIILRVESTSPVTVDTAQMEDMDRKTLIIRTKAGVHYFDKVD